MATSKDSRVDFTTCSICVKTFKTPKHFPCLHSFCEGCLQTYITTALGHAMGGVNCPVCRMFVSKPDDINIEEWAKKLPTNHILVSLIDLNETKSGQKFCAACSRENEVESAFSWCANCSEALCKACDRSHRRNKMSAYHKLIKLDENFSKDTPLQHADVFCTEHLEKKIEAYCYDHSAVCCMTCVMLKHRKCDNVGSIEDAAERKKKSKEIKEFSQNLQDLVSSLEKLCKSRTKNLQTFDDDMKQIQTDVENLFIQLSDHLSELKTRIMSEISNVIKDIKPEIENQHFEMKCRIPAVENNLSLFQINMKHAPPAQFIQAIQKLENQNEILKNFVKDQNQNLREIRITFKANEKLLELSRGIQECGEVKVSRANYEPQHSVTTKINMLASEPTLTATIDTGFHVTGISSLQNGHVVLSNHNNRIIELHDPKCSTILSWLSLPSCPWGIKMISDTEGAVVLGRKGLILFSVQNNQIAKVKNIKTHMNRDFVYHRGQYYIGNNDKITVYDNGLGKLRDITVNDNVGYMAVRDETSLCYTSAVRGRRELYCITMDGNPVFTYSHNKLRCPFGVIVDNAGLIYVCGYDSRNVHQLSHDGKLQRIILDNLPAGPYCISFNTQGDKAVIGCVDKVLQYDLK